MKAFLASWHSCIGLVEKAALGIIAQGFGQPVHLDLTKMMSRNRFEIILSFLRFANNDAHDKVGKPGQDRLFSFHAFRQYMVHVKNCLWMKYWLHSREGRRRNDGVGRKLTDVAIPSICVEWSYSKSGFMLQDGDQDIDHVGTTHLVGWLPTQGKGMRRTWSAITHHRP